MMKAEVNIGLDQGALTSLKGRGPHLIKEKGRAFARLPGMTTFPEVQVFLAPPPELLEEWGVPVITAAPERLESTDLPTDRPAFPHVIEPAHAPAQGQVTGQQVSALGKWGQPILTALEKSEAGLSGRRVSEAVGCSLSVAQTTLKRLLAQGLVLRSSENGRDIWLPASFVATDQNTGPEVVDDGGSDD
jgi:hypothetical protein